MTEPTRGLTEAADYIERLESQLAAVRDFRQHLHYSRCCNERNLRRKTGRTQGVRRTLEAPQYISHTKGRVSLDAIEDACATQAVSYRHVHNG